MHEHLKFLSAFLLQPVRTGAVAPSSPWLAAQMVAGMNLRQARVVVELGPGTGAFTGVIEQQVPKEALFLAVEINREFAEKLKLQFPRACIVNASAERLDECLAQHGHTAADCVLCGLPWAGFSKDLQDRLMSALLKVLRPGGQFATFAYSHAAWLPAGRRFRRLLETNFPQVTTSEVVWRNLPPAFVYRCVR